MTQDTAAPLFQPPAPRILVIDDVRDIADLYAHNLARRGFAVNRAYDALSGLRLANTIAPDVILLNYLMPDLNGLQILAALHKDEKTRRIKVIITSTHEPVRERALAAGAVDFLLVPAQLPVAWEKIARALIL